MQRLISVVLGRLDVVLDTALVEDGPLLSEYMLYNVAKDLFTLQCDFWRLVVSQFAGLEDDSQCYCILYIDQRQLSFCRGGRG